MPLRRGERVLSGERGGAPGWPMLRRRGVEEEEVETRGSGTTQSLWGARALWDACAKGEELGGRVAESSWDHPPEGRRRRGTLFVRVADNGNFLWSRTAGLSPQRCFSPSDCSIEFWKSFAREVSAMS